MPTVVDHHGGWYFQKFENHILKFQKILKKIIHLHMDVFYTRTIFEDDIHYGESYTKKTKSRFETDEQYKHCSLLEMLDFVFFV